MPAFRLSKKMGFRYVETDVSFTADGVAVLLHDASINRTSDGKGKVSEMTFAEVRKYDFGSWKSPLYKGTGIPTLDEFLSFCEEEEMIPYVELKKNGGYTEKQIRSIVDAVDEHGLRGRASFISFAPDYLKFVKDYDSEARLGFLKSKASTSDIPVIRELMTGSNEVFYDVKYATLSDAVLAAFEKEGIPVEVWTVDDVQKISRIHPYITGITSNDKIAGKILYYTRSLKEQTGL